MAEEVKHSNILHPRENATVTTSPEQTGDLPGIGTSRKKSVAFRLTFVAILINLFIYALDATTLAVATPVRAAYGASCDLR